MCVTILVSTMVAPYKCSKMYVPHLHEASRGWWLYSVYVDSKKHKPLCCVNVIFAVGIDLGSVLTVDIRCTSLMKFRCCYGSQ